MLYFYCNGFNNLDLYNTLNGYIRSHKEDLKNTDIRIFGVEGSFPYTFWNGGINNNLNEFTNFVYDDVFRESNLYYLRNILMFSRNNKCMTKEEYCFVRKNDTFKTVLVRTCVRLMPNFVFFFLRSLKKKL